MGPMTPLTSSVSPWKPCMMSIMVWLVDDLAVAAEALVLQHDRQIIDAIGCRQAAIAVGRRR